MTGLAVRCEGISHVYALGGDAVRALSDINLSIPAGSSAAIVGPSGSGKSTLMAVLGGLQRPTSGHAYIGDTDLTALDERGLLRLRAEQLAVVVQNPHRNLIPYGTAGDNLRFAGRGARDRRRRNLPDPDELLHRVGLTGLADVRVDRFSGGERQRLALATGLAGGPAVLLADEPTSQLDEANRDRIVELLLEINAELGITVVAVTHDAHVASLLGRSIPIIEGRLAGEPA